MNKHPKASSILFTNGRVWDDGPVFREAFGVNGKRFDFVGTNTEAGKLRNKYERIIDLGSRLVLPGLIDGHVHLIYGSLIRKSIDGSQIRSFEELKDKVRGYSSSNPHLEVLRGGNLNIEKMGIDFGSVSNNPLDGIISAKPFFISNYDYHSALCNSAALEISGLTKNPDLVSSNGIIKNTSGKLTGLITEEAYTFVINNLPKPGLYEKAAAVEEMIGILHSYGITAVCDITLPENLEVFKLLFARGKLKIHENCYIPLLEYSNFNELRSFTQEIAEDRFSLKGFKGFYDGALGSETALFKENYLGKTSNGHKTELAESGLLLKLAKVIDKSGKQIMIHAIGDKAVSEVLDIYDTIRNKYGNRDRRFRIEHAQHIDKADFDRFNNTGIVASVQPVHMLYDLNKAKEKLPLHTLDRTHDYKNLVSRGATLAFGTDYPIAEIDPFKNIQIAITRSIDGELFHPENCFDLNFCIKAYTKNNAYAAFSEKTYGDIAVWKFADFVILKDNLFDMKPEELSSARVWKTYFEGEQVFGPED